jgi:hypothetical protein
MSSPKAAPDNGSELPLQVRAAPLTSFDEATRTAQVVWTTGAGVLRYDWYNDRKYLEVLSLDPAHVRMGRLQSGAAPVLDTHGQWTVRDVVGVVENASLAGAEGTAAIRFSKRADVEPIVQDVRDGIVRNTSVGYAVYKYERVAPAVPGDPWTYRAIDWEPFELSMVPIGADPDAGVRAHQRGADQVRTFPCVFIDAAPAAHQRNVPMDDVQPTSAPVAAPSADEIAARTAAEGATRAADITVLCQRHRLPHLAADLIRSQRTLDQARDAILNELAARDASSGGHLNVAPRVETLRDEMSTRMAGIEEALHARVDSRVKLSDNGRQYRGLSLLELGRDILEHGGVNTRGLDRMTLASRALSYRSPGMLAASDLAQITASVANKRLRAGYDENPGTYQRWARRAPNAPDFKTMTVVQLSAMPDLLRVNEHGEFKYGSLSDGAETYAVVTFGRIVSLTRQAIVNDDLRALDRMVTGFGASAMRLENRTAYAQLTSNPTMADTVALFHATHANLGTGAGSALSTTSLTAMRAAMRLQKGLQSEELNLVPAFLIVPATLEQTAYQLTSSNFVPAVTTNVNEFRTGGRTAVEPIVEPILDAASTTAWYSAAQNSQVDTVEYCYLDGAEGPVVESEMGFEVDGVSFKCRLDFAAKVLDHRGLYKANGA